MNVLSSVLYASAILWFLLLSSWASAQELYFIQHKPTQSKMMVCAGDDGQPVTSRPASNLGPCVQWEQIANGEYFYLRSVDANKLIRPDTGENGSQISIQPLTWRGNWTQWSYEERGDGYGHIINRGTGKLIFLSGRNRDNIAQQPTAWRGDFTRWRFVSVNSPGPDPTETPTPTVSFTPIPAPTQTTIPTPGPTASASPEPELTLSCEDQGTQIPDRETPFVLECRAAYPLEQPAILAFVENDSFQPVSTRVEGDTLVATFELFANRICSNCFFLVEAVATAGSQRAIFNSGFTVVDGGPVPTPSSAPEPTSTVIEGEDAELFGGSSVYSDGAASGGQGVAFLDVVGRGLRFSNVPLSDSLVVSYASQNTGVISVIVNGEDAGDINFDATGAWGGTYREAALLIDIPSGATVEIVNNPGDVAMNIDFVSFNFGRAVDPGPVVPTPRPMIDPFACDYDPAADDGDGFIFGMTRSGKIYYVVASQKVLTVGIGTEGQIDGLPFVGPFWYTDTQGRTYQRWETHLNEEVDLNRTYNLTYTRRIAPDRFCHDSASVKPGEGLISGEANCAQERHIGLAPEPVHKPSVRIVYEGGRNARLTGGNQSVQPGYALYTSSGNCTSESCLENWPMLTVQKPEWLREAVGLAGELGVQQKTITITQDCGTQLDVTVNQVTYNGQGLHFYAGDETPDSTGGASVPGWRLTSALIENQLPRISDPKSGLRTPINGVSPGSHGYTFDIEGDDLTLNLGPGMEFMMASTEYRDGIGNVIVGPGKNDFEFWCSTNQVQWHLGNLDRVTNSQFATKIPAICGESFDYFFRYEKRGSPTLNEPEYRWSYSGLFTTEGGRINPKTRPVITDRSANWMRFRHPHAQDGHTEVILDARSNNSKMRDLVRFEMSVNDSGSGVNLSPGVSALRIEALENGAFPDFVPVYNYNSGSCCGEAFDYGNVISFEITATVGNISSQTYTTHLNMIAGKGFDSPIGDPRLTMAGAAATNMVFSSFARAERNAVFTQHLTTLETAEDVDTFLFGHHVFHGVPILSPNSNMNLNNERQFGRRKIGSFACGDCHDRDGRGSEVFDTPNGPRLPPPTYGVGLLQWIEGAEAGLTWTGDVATVEEQVQNALVNDHGVDPASLPELDMRRLVDYTRFLTVPNRKPIDHPDIDKGHALFYQAGCADCHKENQRTRSDAPVMFRDLEITPFTDMKLHDIGTGGQFRTPPLWGLGHNIDVLVRRKRDLLYMHDGRATSMREVISQHGGEAQNAQNAFDAMSEKEKNALVRFVESL